MKLITSISLSILFMFQAVMPNIDKGGEFQKIAEIYSHYKDHKVSFGDSFLDFVVTEYLNSDGSAEEHHENSNHHEAPSHNSHQCSHITYFITYQSQSFLQDFNYSENPRFDYYKAFFSSAYLDTLFQPPRA